MAVRAHSPPKPGGSDVNDSIDRSDSVEEEKGESVGSSPLRSALAGAPPPPFRFQDRRGRINLRKVGRIDLDDIVRNTRVDLLQRHLGSLTFGRLSSSDVASCSDETLVKLFRITQLQIEYAVHVQGVLHAHAVAVERELERLEHECKGAQRRLQDRHSRKKSLRKATHARERLAAKYEAALRAARQQSAPAAPASSGEDDRAWLSLRRRQADTESELDRLRAEQERLRRALQERDRELDDALRHSSGADRRASEAERRCDSLQEQLRMRESHQMVPVSAPAPTPAPAPAPAPSPVMVRDDAALESLRHQVRSLEVALRDRDVDLGRIKEDAERFARERQQALQEEVTNAWAMLMEERKARLEAQQAVERVSVEARPRTPPRVHRVVDQQTQTAEQQEKARRPVVSDEALEEDVRRLRARLEHSERRREEADAEIRQLMRQLRQQQATKSPAPPAQPPVDHGTDEEDEEGEEKEEDEGEDEEEVEEVEEEGKHDEEAEDSTGLWLGTEEEEVPESIDAMVTPVAPDDVGSRTIIRVPVDAVAQPRDVSAFRLRRSWSALPIPPRSGAILERHSTPWADWGGFVSMADARDGSKELLPLPLRRWASMLPVATEVRHTQVPVEEIPVLKQHYDETDGEFVDMEEETRTITHVRLWEVRIPSTYSVSLKLSRRNVRRALRADISVVDRAMPEDVEHEVHVDGSTRAPWLYRQIAQDVPFGPAFWSLRVRWHGKWKVLREDSFPLQSKDDTPSLQEVLFTHRPRVALATLPSAAKTREWVSQWRAHGPLQSEEDHRRMQLADERLKKLMQRRDPQPEEPCGMVDMPSVGVIAHMRRVMDEGLVRRDPTTVDGPNERMTRLPTEDVVAPSRFPHKRVSKQTWNRRKAAIDAALWARIQHACEDNQSSVPPQLADQAAEKDVESPAIPSWWSARANAHPDDDELQAVDDAVGSLLASEPVEQAQASRIRRHVNRVMRASRKRTEPVLRKAWTALAAACRAANLRVPSRPARAHTSDDESDGEGVETESHSQLDTEEYAEDEEEKEEQEEEEDEDDEGEVSHPVATSTMVSTPRHGGGSDDGESSSEDESAVDAAAFYDETEDGDDEGDADAAGLSSALSPMVVERQRQRQRSWDDSVGGGRTGSAVGRASETREQLRAGRMSAPGSDQGDGEDDAEHADTEQQQQQQQQHDDEDEEEPGNNEKVRDAPATDEEEEWDDDEEEFMGMGSSRVRHRPEIARLRQHRTSSTRSFESDTPPEGELDLEEATSLLEDIETLNRDSPAPRRERETRPASAGHEASRPQRPRTAPRTDLEVEDWDGEDEGAFGV